MERFEFWDEIAEQRIEAMLADGARVVDAAIAEHKPVAIFAGFSGGNDSVVSTHFAVEHYDAIPIFCDTLIGLDATREHIRRTSERADWDLQTKRAVPCGPPKKHTDGSPFDPASLPAGRWTDGSTSYEEACFNFGMPGPGQHPRMYQRLKERLFDAFKADAKRSHNRMDRVLFITGIRHDESVVRAGYQAAVHRRGGSVWVAPFYAATAADFALYREEFGLPQNPVSPIVGISGECLCGTMGDRSELKGIDRIEPKTGDYIRGLESKCESLGLPCRWATRPPKKRSCAESDSLQLRLFGDGPEFQPACVGCLRRHAG